MTSQNYSRSIIITGANNGIGLAITRSLLEIGDRVAALDLETDNLAPTHPNLIPFRCPSFRTSCQISVIFPYSCS